MTNDPQTPDGQPAPPYGQEAAPYDASRPLHGGPAAYAGVPGAQRNQFAGWGQRVLASVIDSFVVAVVPWIFFMYAILTSETETSAFGGAEAVPTPAGEVALAIGGALYLVIWFWNRGYRQGTTGRSVGKSVLKIRLVGQETGQPIGKGSAFLRELAHIADAPLYLGYLWPIWDEKRQTFSDKIMDTVVVREASA